RHLLSHGNNNSMATQIDAKLIFMRVRGVHLAHALRRKCSLPSENIVNTRSPHMPNGYSSFPRRPAGRAIKTCPKLESATI
ncbi:hypothetical protein RRG08_055439, partial [Elysia crispata]